MSEYMYNEISKETYGFFLYQTYLAEKYSLYRKIVVETEIKLLQKDICIFIIML